MPCKPRTGSEPILKGKLDQKNIAAAEFRVETVPISKVQLIDIRGLFKKVGLNTQLGQESVHAVECLSRLNKLAEAAGGDAPLPKYPDISHLADIANRVGNDQFKVIHENKDRLAHEIADWQKRGDLIVQRQPRWVQLTGLLNFAADLPVAAEVRPEVTAIEQHRSLLADPDPVPGMIEKLTAGLRVALNEAHAACRGGFDAGQVNLDASPAWQQLTPEQRYELRMKHGVRVVPPINVGTTEEVLDTLRQTKLSELRAVCDALPTRFSSAAAAAAKLLEPKAQRVALPSGTIRNEEELRVWLTAVEAAIRAQASGRAGDRVRFEVPDWNLDPEKGAFEITDCDFKEISDDL